jgi:hypothetical protein
MNSAGYELALFICATRGGGAAPALVAIAEFNVAYMPESRARRRLDTSAGASLVCRMPFAHGSRPLAMHSGNQYPHQANVMATA